LIFENPEDYDNVEEMDELLIENTFLQLKKGVVKVKNMTNSKEYKMILKITPIQKEIIVQGGLLNLVKSKGSIKE
jgi:aconitate hydratase